jgi:predicted transcriptional regulator
MTRPPPPTGAPHSKSSLAVRLDDDTLRALDDWARAEGMTPSALAARLIDEALRRRREKTSS